MNPSHEWGDPTEDGPEQHGRPTRRKACRHCGLQASFVQAGDAAINKRYLIDGGWKSTKAPACVRAKVKKMRKKEWTEAQRMTFLAPFPPRRL